MRNRGAGSLIVRWPSPNLDTEDDVPWISLPSKIYTRTQNGDGSRRSRRVMPVGLENSGLRAALECV